MDSSKRGPFTIKGTREIYSNPWIHVSEDSVERPDGSTGIFGIVDIIPGVTIVAMDEKNNVLLSHEFRYAVNRVSIELISGGMEAGEDPLDCAKRELEEEAGVIAEKWVSLGCLDPFTSVIRSPNWMFLARGFHEGKTASDSSEILSIERVPFSEVLQMVMDGKISHGASSVAVLKVSRYLGLS
ncbi:NUDIX hydrolase [Candidatus Uhrbacteria bacterium]|nr:NUDIX hydrolase [Candidatus Uhrbacteria bacterium]